MLDEGSTDPLGSLEALSAQVKQTHFTPATAVAPPPPPLVPTTEPAAWHESTSKLLQVPLNAEEAEEVDGHNPNLVEEAAYFACAGVGLGPEETYRVFASLHALQQAKQLATVRFFGKVLGSCGRDYYICEATYVSDPEPAEDAPEPPADMEARGTGVNTYSYFATNDPASDWTELPLVLPAQLLAAAKIRKYFTGDLSAPVRAYPPFPGNEAAYLRAQIAFIAHATTLCPKGKFVATEDDPTKVEPNGDEEYKPISHDEMASAASWLRYHPGILSTVGRVTHMPKEEEEADEDGEPKPAEPPLEAETPALAPIAPDEWSVQLHAHAGDGAAVAIARSSAWPGAYCATVMKEDKCANLYVGYGHCAMSAPFVVPPPPPVCAEPAELSEEKDTPLAEENSAIEAAELKKLEEMEEEAPEE